MNDRRPVLLRTFAILRKSFGSIYAAAAWPYALSLVVLLVFGVLLKMHLTGGQGRNPAETWATLGPIAKCGVMLVYVSTIWLPLALSFGTVSFFVFNICAGNKLSVHAAITQVVSRFVRISTLSLLLGFAVSMGSAFYVIPGILVQTFTAFAIPCVVVEDRTVFESIERSIRLTRLRFWRVFGVFLLGIVLAGGLILAALIFAPLIFPEPLPGTVTTHNNVGNMVLFVVALVLLGPPLAILLAGTILSLLYYDARQILDHLQNTDTVSVKLINS